MFQKFSAGMPGNLCCFAIDGEIVAMYEHRSWRTLKGQGVFREIVEPTPAAVRGARAMLGHLRWNGPAQFCFLKEPGSEHIDYIETNGRIWSSIAGGMHAGWDMPYWTYRLFVDGERPEPPPIRIGSRTCWHRGDLVALANYLAGGESPSKGRRPGKLRAIANYLGGFHPAIHADAFARDDPLPELVDHWQVLRRGFTALRRGLLHDEKRLSGPASG